MARLVTDLVPKFAICEHLRGTFLAHCYRPKIQGHGGGESQRGLRNHQEVDNARVVLPPLASTVT